MSTLVRHVMTESPKTLRPTMTAEDAAGLMARYDIVSITDAETLVDVVTDRDLVVRVLAARPDPARVHLGTIATTSPVTISPDTRLSDARELMQRHRVRRLPVVKADKLVGILSFSDLAVADPSRRAICAISESEETTNRTPGPEIGAPGRT